MSCLVDLQIRGCFPRVSSVLKMDLTRSSGKFLLFLVSYVISWCVKVKFEIQRFREFDNDVCGYKHQNFSMDGEIIEMGILNCLSRVKSQYQGTYWAQTWISRSHNNRLHFCSQQWCWGGGWFWYMTAAGTKLPRLRSKPQSLIVKEVLLLTGNCSNWLRIILPESLRCSLKSLSFLVKASISNRNIRTIALLSPILGAPFRGKWRRDSGAANRWLIFLCNIPEATTRTVTFWGKSGIGQLESDKPSDTGMMFNWKVWSLKPAGEFQNRVQYWENSVSYPIWNQ